MKKFFMTLLLLAGFVFLAGCMHQNRGKGVDSSPCCCCFTQSK